MIAICTFKTKIGYKKFITLIGSNKLISAKNSESHLKYNLILIISDDCLHVFFFCTDHIGKWPMNEQYCRQMFNLCENKLPLPMMGFLNSKPVMVSQSVPQTTTQIMTEMTPTTETFTFTETSNDEGENNILISMKYRVVHSGM